MRIKLVALAVLVAAYFKGALTEVEGIGITCGIMVLVFSLPLIPEALIFASRIFSKPGSEKKKIAMLLRASDISRMVHGEQAFANIPVLKELSGAYEKADTPYKKERVEREIERIKQARRKGKHQDSQQATAAEDAENKKMSFGLQHLIAVICITSVPILYERIDWSALSGKGADIDAKIEALTKQFSNVPIREKGQGGQEEQAEKDDPALELERRELRANGDKHYQDACRLISEGEFQAAMAELDVAVAPQFQSTENDYAHCYESLHDNDRAVAYFAMKPEEAEVMRIGLATTTAGERKAALTQNGFPAWLEDGPHGRSLGAVLALIKHHEQLDLTFGNRKRYPVKSGIRNGLFICASSISHRFSAKTQRKWIVPESNTKELALAYIRKGTSSSVAYERIFELERAEKLLRIDNAPSLELAGVLNRLYIERNEQYSPTKIARLKEAISLCEQLHARPEYLAACRLQLAEAFYSDNSYQYNKYHAGEIRSLGLDALNALNKSSLKEKNLGIARCEFILGNLANEANRLGEAEIRLRHAADLTKSGPNHFTPYHKEAITSVVALMKHRPLTADDEKFLKEVIMEEMRDKRQTPVMIDSLEVLAWHHALNDRYTEAYRLANQRRSIPNDYQTPATPDLPQADVVAPFSPDGKHLDALFTLRPCSPIGSVCGGGFYPYDDNLLEIVRRKLKITEKGNAIISDTKRTGATAAVFEKTMKERITRALNKAKTKVDRVSSVEVTVKKDGTVDHVKLTPASHFGAGDGILIEAIMEGAPYPAIREQANIVFTLSPPLTGDKNAFRLKGEFRPDFDSYMQQLQYKIKNCWYAHPSREVDHTIKVAFRVNADGSLQEEHVSQACGSSYSDNCALRAVKWAAPFDPLPLFAPERVSIVFTFNERKSFACHTSEYRRF